MRTNHPFVPAAREASEQESLPRRSFANGNVFNFATAHLHRDRDLISENIGVKGQLRRTQRFRGTLAIRVKRTASSRSSVASTIARLRVRDDGHGCPFPIGDGPQNVDRFDDGVEGHHISDRLLLKNSSF
jgi:hypothetical protein